MNKRRQPIQGLLSQLLSLGGEVEVARQRMMQELLRGTVLFSYLDHAAGRARVAGSGVIADLDGTQVVFTAAHVLVDFKHQFDAGEVCLSVNRANGRFMVRSEFPRLTTPDAEHGPDAGVLVLPESAGATYFNFGGFEPPRTGTMALSAPPIGIDCGVAGFPASLALPLNNEVGAELQLGLDGAMMFIGTRVETVDDTYLWLDTSGPIRRLDGSAGAELRPGDLEGMSGCGCWLLEGDADSIRQLHSKPADHPGPLPSHPIALSLYGIHSGTTVGKLRETRLSSHLRLLANLNHEMRAKIQRLWPTLDLR